VLLGYYNRNRLLITLHLAYKIHLVFNKHCFLLNSTDYIAPNFMCNVSLMPKRMVIAVDKFKKCVIDSDRALTETNNQS